MEIRIAGLAEESIVDGPGFRYTIFTQGCPHNCKGCHNPQTHDPNGGRLDDTDRIFEQIIKDPLLDGVTFSGGEPFCQCKPLVCLAKKIRSFNERKLGIISYTGYTFEQLMKRSETDPDCKELLSLLDYLVDGRYEEDKRSLELKFRGSSNQRFIDVQRSLKEGRAVEADTEYL
ncbi:anaerobic ribonucleoside-triphosphate reductase activating protein [Ruminococcus sp.]|uniref:anaerobic ribonucleoside-triphosphate reductase activating protein n=1 Tax=Ruminococcus sp. TaxID=41978 RepID=UPI001B0D178C|nr:anaerobic ribonucleoside-triphosphate reductase activating protein [Ruminococcus sp.]MBE6872921.1 anaerobic ribonucleoside-triphosphate reductase activating protein [Ruminococcus albus]MBO5559767.1 anaerobic ribonucleoside-triphosphate reductase activating protein [Ruminococcus sp.]MBQ9541574.1 anaerobic ribonucleoside-triphosphate reductase activating protein [Ruminococcus sp.]MBR0530863.1 anaerobic ribonucleoside-triphosphate reductase activating protein [Ruminococcus sp.]